MFLWGLLGFGALRNGLFSKPALQTSSVITSPNWAQVDKLNLFVPQVACMSVYIEDQPNDMSRTPDKVKDSFIRK